MYLKKELSAWQDRLMESEKVIECESVKAKTLSADKESLQQHVQLLSSQVQDL